VAFEVRKREEYFDLLPVLKSYRRGRRSAADETLVAKRLASVETCLRELRSLARPALIETDVRERRFIEHTLQLAIQAALDVASHVVADERLGEPETRAELFTLLERAGWLSADLSGRLVRDVVENHLGDLDDFVAALRSRLSNG